MLSLFDFMSAGMPSQACVDAPWSCVSGPAQFTPWTSRSPLVLCVGTWRPPLSTAPRGRPVPDQGSPSSSLTRAAQAVRSACPRESGPDQQMVRPADQLSMASTVQRAYLRVCHACGAPIKRPGGDHFLTIGCLHSIYRSVSILVFGVSTDPGFWTESSPL
jgi:hypothetical protein